jgi:hypothetical protein
VAGLALRRLTLADFPRAGVACLVYGSLSPYPGPGRWDVANWRPDGDGVGYWFGGRFRCEAKAGGPAVRLFAELDTAAAEMLIDETEAKA